MSAADLLLTVWGQDDRWLSMAPDRTYFEAKYQPRVNRSRETFEIPFDNQDATFGSTGRCTIPVKGDYMTRMTLRTVMPPIYPTVPGQYVYPTPSSQVGGTVYVNKTLTLVVADGVTLTANTVGNHYFSIGAQVTLAGTAYVIFDLDGTYTITGIPTANSFTCSTTLAGISYNGTVSSPGIQCGDIISYFSTTNSNLWVNNVTNKTWQITGSTVVGNQVTFTTSAPSNFPVGSEVFLNLPDFAFVNYTCTVLSSTDTTFTVTDVSPRFVAIDPSTNVARTYIDNTWSISKKTQAAYWRSVTFGNGYYVAIGDRDQNATGGRIMYSQNGKDWSSGQNLPSGTFWFDVAYGAGKFVAVSGANTGAYAAYSTDNGKTWTLGTGYPPGDITWRAVTYGGGKFVAVGQFSIMVSADGVNWVLASGYYPFSAWLRITYGGGIFVALGGGGHTIIYSSDGNSWTGPVSIPITAYDITHGNGYFVAVGGNSVAYSQDAISWYVGTIPPATSNPYGYGWNSVAYGNGQFVAVAGYDNDSTPTGQEKAAYSTNNGLSWTLMTFYPGINWISITYGQMTYVSNPSNFVSLKKPPLTIGIASQITSDVYPSISFANAADAAFWGFDARNGLTYSLPVTPPWTLTQSGWISGFLPPSTSTYDDSVAHKLCKAVRVLVGKQTIKEYSGEYIELQNDLLVPYENKAILKLLNGTLDQTQATVAREYYVNLPLGTKEVPLCALTHQNMSVEVDFDSYMNLSQNLNQGTGDLLDAKSYTTYDASTGILGGQPVNVQTTFSYQQYIFIVTYGGQFIIFDTTKNVDDPASYIVLSAFSGSNLFKQFCVLSGNLYIGLTNGQLARMIITELIQGNISSFIVNNYTPTIGSLTGTIVADFRYVYYTVSNTVTSNVFVSKYDTTGTFTSPGSYTVVDFTATFNSNVAGVYQTLSTGAELFMLPMGTPGSLYTYQLNANVQSQWYLLDYSSYGSQITSGVIVNNDAYFIIDSYNFLNYSNGTFYLTVFQTIPSFAAIGAVDTMYSFNADKWTKSTPPLYSLNNGYCLTSGKGIFVGLAYSNGGEAYSNDGIHWTIISCPGAYWSDVTYGNARFVAVGRSYSNQGVSMYSDDGIAWTTATYVDPVNQWSSVTYGNGKFVAVGTSSMYSGDGISWTPASGSVPAGSWMGVTYGNGNFVAVGTDSVMVSTSGTSWTSASGTVQTGSWTSVTYGNGVFVATSETGSAMYSIYGNSWLSAAVPPGGTINAVNFYGIFVAVGSVVSYSSDGNTWTRSSSYPMGSVYFTPNWRDVCGYQTNSFPGNVGNNFRNLLSVGNYIYCSSSSSTFIRFDITDNFSYELHTLPGTSPLILANGPRYIYLFTQEDPTATNIVEFDPYGPDTSFKASILVDYESLPPEVSKPDKALLGLVQTQKVTDMNYMNIRGPVKELWVTGASATTNVFQYSNLAPRSSLALTGEKIVTEDEGTHTFLNIIEPFETHTSMPIRNVSVVAFELDPESAIPNGTINFSRIRDQVFEGGAQTVWARNYNLLAIQGGIGGLIFNS